MKNIKSKHRLLLVAVALWTSITQAQEAVTASGSTASGSGGSVAYSVGQVEHGFLSGSSGSVSQGVQHAYEIFTLDIAETVGQFSLAVFPNPTPDLLTLQAANYTGETLSYRLHDIQGKVVNKGVITGPKTQVDMSRLPSATYFLTVLHLNTKNMQSFKIIKH